MQSDERHGVDHLGLSYGDCVPSGLSVVGESDGLSRAALFNGLEQSEMTPNDLYSECVPRPRKRKATVCMVFPLTERKFMGRPTLADENKARESALKANRRKVMPYRILEQLDIKCAPMERDGEIHAQ